MAETTVLFVGETKMQLYKCSSEIGDLFKEHMKQYDTPEGRQVDDSYWDVFYATLSLDQRQAVVLLNEAPVHHTV